MPVIEPELAKKCKSRVLAGVDFTDSYWQFLIHTTSRVCQSIISVDGAFTPTRLLYGTTNAVLHLQSFLSTKIPLAFSERVLLWVEDCRFHEE